ncbi:hypothetical protein A2765_01670 [Candidatus Kaiserbacteria bacterium RIFCSPHIGHO2_01_FULL_56_24]|uniref:Uncharacterized protein n=1 Tax=Candidatus Kaiserbacteria bacterium RIFCSPHIGHO2_01_FULL_56_24 TaxID=1798487 RepID=A0A1F6DHK1_9BACT|nr:MAG: hypothetical protein A2765_01670 [Candidatus Kaiserbacteria bacterium RIFCSPHIGHO2_01_FULL_56_24]
MEKTNMTLVDATGDSGVEALRILMEAEALTPALEERLGATMASSFDGWPFHLRQRLAKKPTDLQWERLIRFLKLYSTAQPPLLWYCELIADMGGHARSLSDTDPWKKPAKRILEELGTRYR